MKTAIIIAIALVCAFLGGYISRHIAQEYPEPFKPSSLLRFKPVYEGSDPNDVTVAQAELCRHGIDVDIDGDCGKGTAMGLCELICKIENGYKVHTMFERNQNVEEKR